MSRQVRAFFQESGADVARGAAFGAGLALGLVAAFFALALALELLNGVSGGALRDLVGPVSGSRRNLLNLGFAGVIGVFKIWSWLSFLNAAAYFAAIGCPVGAVYGFALGRQKRRPRQGLPPNNPFVQ